MPEEINPVYDMLASVTADLDQVQALIDEARSKFSNEPLFKVELDRQQSEVDSRRAFVKQMKDLADVIQQM
jgi:hypothetical protein